MMSGKPPPYVPLQEDAPPDIGHPRPGYSSQQGYPPPPPQHGYPPPQQGYPPPQHGYPPPQHGYPPPQHGYPPPHQGYQPPPPQPVMVINNQPAPAAASNTVVVNTTHVQQKQGINHCLHCCISIFFFPWLFVWCCLCICE